MLSTRETQQIARSAQQGKFFLAPQQNQIISFHKAGTLLEIVKTALPEGITRTTVISMYMTRKATASHVRETHTAKMLERLCVWPAQPRNTRTQAQPRVANASRGSTRTCWLEAAPDAPLDDTIPILAPHQRKTAFCALLAKVPMKLAGPQLVILAGRENIKKMLGQYCVPIAAKESTLTLLEVSDSEELQSWEYGNFTLYSATPILYFDGTITVTQF